jgi:hypothetical protein
MREKKNLAKEKLFFYSFISQPKMCDLSDLPKSYCDYDLGLMEEIANKYDFGVLMDADLSEFWSFLLNVKANIEEKCNATWICSEMMEIIFEKCFYCVLETHYPKPEHLELGCNFIRNLPGMSACDRERNLVTFQDVFKKYQE